MAIRTEAVGGLGSIVELEDGAQIIAKLLDIRKTQGDGFEGCLVDLETLAGVRFSINGHKILVDKLHNIWSGPPLFVEICREGMIGRAVNYQVWAVISTADQLSADDSEQSGLIATEEYITKKITSLPPRD